MSDRITVFCKECFSHNKHNIKKANMFFEHEQDLKEIVEALVVFCAEDRGCTGDCDVCNIGTAQKLLKEIWHS